MSKFEQSRPDHEVHELHQHQGHGMLDQKRDKGMRSPIVSSVPNIDNGTVPGSTAGGPGVPNGMYGGSDQTGS
jgi:hypothetical protein